MSRQSEIDKIIELWREKANESTCAVKPISLLAEHLVDNGIGTKDRFEIEKDGVLGFNKDRQHVSCIKPIDYKEDNGKTEKEN